MRVAAILVCAACGDDATAWRAPAPIALDRAGSLDDPTLTGDRRELLFNVDGTAIATATRTSPDAPFGPTHELVELAGPGALGNPEVSPDGRTLYVTSSRDGTFDVFVATRAARGDTWGPLVAVPELDSPAEDFAATATADDLTLVLTSNRGTSADLYLATRGSRTEPWSTPVPIAEVNSDAHDAGGMLSADGLALYFDSDRAGTNDLYVARRTSPDEPFGAPEPIAELDTDANEDDAWISSDERTLVFSSDRGGLRGLWQATR